MEFVEFPKIARLSRDIVVTEKIDGTNASVKIVRLAGHEVMPTETPIVAVVGDLLLYAGSRSRWITPDDDNFGFASWVKGNAESLVRLGEGTHFGEWWGGKIQRGYGLKEKRFSLFNVSRWCDHRSEPIVFPTADPRVTRSQERAPECCSVVPTLYRGAFETKAIDYVLDKLMESGSMAAPGFMRPEGIVVFHTASGGLYKKTIEKDEAPKSRVVAVA